MDTAADFAQYEGNDEATRLIYVGTPADFLELEKAVELEDVDGNSIASPGDILQYTITFNNTTQNELTGGLILDDFDESLLQTPYEISGGGTVANGAITWNIGAIGEGLGSVSYKVLVNEFPGGVATVANTAVLDTDQTPPVGALAEIDIISNQPPWIDGQSFDADENQTAVDTVVAIDPDLPDDTLTFSITGEGPDDAKFSILPTGELSFVLPPDYESPNDVGEIPGDNVYLVEVRVTDSHDESATAMMSVTVLNQASITGDVFVDVNQNGLREANDLGIDGVVIELQLLDEFGNPVGDPLTTTTSLGGLYFFEDLDPGIYQLHELQPTGVDDGAEILGSLGGLIPANTNDTMQLTLVRTDATDYIFAELGQQVASGDTATIGFWHNKHGQALIAQGGAGLAQWLTDNFGNVFGDEFVAEIVGDDVTYVDGAYVAQFFNDQLFKQIGQKSAGPAKVDAQFMAVALATYFTSSNLAGGSFAASYGFNVTETGIGTKIVNVGSNGAAFNVADGADLTIMGLLLATNNLTDTPTTERPYGNLLGFAHIYDINGDGVIDETEATLRAMANEVYSGINEQGDI